MNMILKYSFFLTGVVECCCWCCCCCRRRRPNAIVAGWNNKASATDKRENINTLWWMSNERGKCLSIRVFHSCFLTHDFFSSLSSLLSCACYGAVFCKNGRCRCRFASLKRKSSKQNNNKIQLVATFELDIWVSGQQLFICFLSYI